MVCVVGAVAIACTAEPPGCPREIGEDIQNATVSVFNSTSGGGSAGSDYSCAGGGSAHITSTITQNGSASRTEDITYTFANCHDTASNNTLTITGTLHEHSTRQLGSSGYFCVDCNYTSDALTVSGTEILCNADPIMASCVVDITFANASGSGFGDESGSICGLKYP